MKGSVAAAPLALLQAVKKLLLKGTKALLVLLLLVIPVPIASLFAQGGKGPRRNLPGQVVKREDDGG